MKNTAVVDLFCGIGGLTHGFKVQNFNVVAGIDNDTTCRFAYESNNQATFIAKDIQEIEADAINNLYPPNTKIRVLVGCAPCQPFSKYNHRIGRKIEETEDGKWKLLYKFAEIITAIKPEIISMENVPQLVKHDIFHEFIRVLKANNYFVSEEANIVYCPDYGVPQKRKRLVLIASLLGPIELIPKTHKKENYVTVKKAIGDLNPLASGETDANDALHRASKLSELNLTRIKSTKEGGSWRDWDESLRLACHKKLSGTTFGDVYGRMKWDEPSPTMTTHCTGIGNGRFGHPEQDRAISLREASIFQSFPPNYKFIDDTSQSLSVANISRQIGNAVPVRLGEVIAISIKNHLKNLNLI